MKRIASWVTIFKIWCSYRVPMNEKTVTVELPVSDWQSVLSVLKFVVESHREEENPDMEVVEILTLLYEEMDRQLADGDGTGHVHGLYSRPDDS